MTFVNLINDCQDDMYQAFNKFSKDHSVSGRLLALPIALADVLLDITKYPLSAIEEVAQSVFQLFGALCREDCTINGAIYHLHFGLSNIPATAIELAFGVVKLFYQTLAVFYDPTTVNSIRPNTSGFKPADYVRPKFTPFTVMQKIQNAMYSSFNVFATEYTLAGRVLALPLALTDVLLDTIKYPAAIIDNLVRSLFHLIGALCCQEGYEIKASIHHLVFSLEHIPGSLVAAALIPIKLLYQTLAVFFSPEEIHPISGIEEMSSVSSVSLST